MQDRGAFDTPPPMLLFISSRQLADAYAGRVRVPAWHHFVMDHTFPIPLLHVFFASVPSVTHGWKGGGRRWECGVGRIHDAIPLVRIDHGHLNVGVAQLDWSCDHKYTEKTDQAVGP